MKLQRLLALSSSAVIAAACSSGGSSVAPHATATATGTGTNAAKHAANAKITLKLPANYVRLKKPSKTAAGKMRSPAFVDPGQEGTPVVIAVRVDNYGPSGSPLLSSYMATTNGPVSGSAIPVYLAPGEDTITVQEYAQYIDPDGGGYLLSQYTGYLLAQGQTVETVGEGTSGLQGLNVTMQMVIGDNLSNSTSDGGPEYGSPGIAIITDNAFDSVGYDGRTAFFSTSTSSAADNVFCVQPSPSTTLYFLPVDDEYGSENPFQNGGAGNINANQGLPFIQVSTSAINASGAASGSSLIQSPLGYYTPNFENPDDEINVNVAFPNGVLVDPYFAPSTQAASPFVPLNIDPTNFEVSYHATLASDNSTYCEGQDHGYAVGRKKPGTSVVRKPPHKT